MKDAWILTKTEVDRSHSYDTPVVVFDGQPSIPKLQNALIKAGMKGDDINQAILQYRAILDGILRDGDALVWDQDELFWYFTVVPLEQ